MKMKMSTMPVSLCLSRCDCSGLNILSATARWAYVLLKSDNWRAQCQAGWIKTNIRRIVSLTDARLSCLCTSSQLRSLPAGAAKPTWRELLSVSPCCRDEILRPNPPTNAHWHVPLSASCGKFFFFTHTAFPHFGTVSPSLDHFWRHFSRSVPSQLTGVN